ncbi:hypothetical protein ACOME3_001834 [Neoechinorhynchus agilis]
MAENSRLYKNVGLTIETRPDYCLRPHLNDMLSYGVTKVEIGVQSLYEDVARDTNRGHTVHAAAECFENVVDCGLKLVTHMMPNLPNVDLERDIAQFKEMFENPAFRCDGLKIYPTLVIRSTGLYELWRRGLFKVHPPSIIVNLMAQILSLIPPYVRVHRVQRDIPFPVMSSGGECGGNLRELAHKKLAIMGLRCRDVRSREPGSSSAHLLPNIALVRRDYAAQNSWETMLSYEDTETDTLVALLRLRKLGRRIFRKELNGNCSIVRELHVYGPITCVGNRDKAKYQHQVRDDIGGCGFF